MKVDEHKHFGNILDSKLSFSAHIKSAISKTRKGIGLLKYLSKYLPRHTLNELNKLYVRPHLDYGVLFTIFQQKYASSVVASSLFSILLRELLQELGEEHCEKSCTRSLAGNH